MQSLLNTLLDPVERAQLQQDYTYKRTKLTHLQLLGQLRSRVGFFQIFHMFDKYEQEKLINDKFKER